MLDGNFEAQHERMKIPGNDVEITNGTGIMADTVKYKTYLDACPERPAEVSKAISPQRVTFLTFFGLALNLQRSPGGEQGKHQIQPTG